MPEERGPEYHIDADRVRSLVDLWRDVGMDGWFRVDPAFDRLLAHRFMDDHFAAARRERDDWAETPDGALALLILLDQFPRNAFRGTAHMYATDPLALVFARRFLDMWFDEAFEPDLRMFFYLPFTHSERLADQELSLARRRALGPRIERRAAEHLEIIARFGRFPHRNKVLGRDTTPAEQAYLDGGGFSG